MDGRDTWHAWYRTEMKNSFSGIVPKLNGPKEVVRIHGVQGSTMCCNCEICSVGQKDQNRKAYDVFSGKV